MEGLPGQTPSHFFFRVVFHPLALVVAVYTVLHVYLNLSGLRLGYLDEQVYLGCGVEYIRGACPLDCNPEHPPLAKYVYGVVAATLGLAGVRVLLYVVAVTSIVMVYWAVKARHGERDAALTSMLVATDALVANVWSSALLDNVTVLLATSSYALFALWGVRSRSYLAASSLLAALAVYSKYTAAFYLLAVAAAAALAGDRVYRRTLLAYLALTLAFTAALLPVVYYECLHSRGLGGVAASIVGSFEYHGRLHGFKPVTAGISLLKVLAGAEVWRVYNVNFTMSNGTLYMAGEPEPGGVMVDFNLGEYAPHASILAVLLALRLLGVRICGPRIPPRRLELAPLSMATAMLLSLLEPIAWYYQLMHYYAAISMPDIAETQRCRNLIVAANTAYLVALLAAVILFKSYRLTYTL